MKKTQIFFICLIIIISVVIMFIKEYQVNILIDDTIIDATQFSLYKKSKVNWVSGAKQYYAEENGAFLAVSQVCNINGSATSISSFYQYSYLYKNKLRATIAFYLNSPNIYYRDEWPNFYNKSWNLSKEANLDLKADRFIYYCGIGSTEDCQVWNFWAQYDNIIILFGLYDFKDGNSVEELEHFVSELDIKITDLVEK